MFQIVRSLFAIKPYEWMTYLYVLKSTERNEVKFTFIRTVKKSYGWRTLFVVKQTDNALTHVRLFRGSSFPSCKMPIYNFIEQFTFPILVQTMIFHPKVNTFNTYTLINIIFLTAVDYKLIITVIFITFFFFSSFNLGLDTHSYSF